MAHYTKCSQAGRRNAADLGASYWCTCDEIAESMIDWNAAEPVAEEDL